MHRLEHDNQMLYFVLGALTDAIAQLPRASQEYLIKILEQKYRHADGEHRDTLATLIEALQTQAEKNARPST